MIHELKITPEYFSVVASGEKTFEIREVEVSEREFYVGDYMALNEYNHAINDGIYTGRCMLVQITYILDDAAYCKSGYVVLGFRPCRIVPETGEDMLRAARTFNVDVHGRELLFRFERCDKPEGED